MMMMMMTKCLIIMCPWWWWLSRWPLYNSGGTVYFFLICHFEIVCSVRMPKPEKFSRTVGSLLPSENFSRPMILLSLSGSENSSSCPRRKSLSKVRLAGRTVPKPSSESNLTGCGFCCFLLGIFQLAFLFATSSGFPRKQSTHSPKYPALSAWRVK